MPKLALDNLVVGLIANPVSARDIRRVIANASSMPIADRANIVLRVMAALGVCGVPRVLMMPENGGIRKHLTRSLKHEKKWAMWTFPAYIYVGDFPHGLPEKDMLPPDYNTLQKFARVV